MTLPTNDDFAKSELSTGELETISGGRLIVTHGPNPPRGRTRWVPWASAAAHGAPALLSGRRPERAGLARPLLKASALLIHDTTPGPHGPGVFAFTARHQAN